MEEKDLLKTIRHIAIATVNDDGTPHNTPLFFIYNEDFSKLYMSTHPESLHSKNIERTGTGYAVAYDSNVFRGGLYMTLQNFHQVTSTELSDAIQVYNSARARWGMDSLPIEYYQEPNLRRLYVADIIKIEKYGTDEDASGQILNEYRTEISSLDLIDN